MMIARFFWGARFSDTDHALDMALEGRGVTMGRVFITERLLQGGQLVAPFPLALRTQGTLPVFVP